MNRYENLLKSWCDKLIDLKISEIEDERIKNSIICPACGLIHGRIGDAVYPFVTMYDRTKNEKYLEAAKAVVDWSECNVRRADGGYYNDKAATWKGITVFSAMSLGDTLYYHSECLDEKTRSKWLGIFMRFAEFVIAYFNIVHSNINYDATYCAVMAFAYKFSGDEKYKEAAYKKYNFVKEHFTDDGLLRGEGHDVPGKNLCKYVDLGYNVEESLPAIACFGHLMNDTDVLKSVFEKFVAHLEFMLPDGGWDNSWGSRSNKWTYWGSRTSDGAATGLCYLTNYNDAFSEAIERNFNILEKCSEDGFLYGGIMYRDFKEEPCIHHSFCHAKSLAIMLDTGFEYKNPTALPRDIPYGVKKFPSVNVNLISIGKIRATVTNNDAVDYYKTAPTGGSIGVLWTENAGILLAATAPQYGPAMTEPRNMQLSRNRDKICNCTMRISNGEFESDYDRNAVVDVVQSENSICVTAKGSLSNSALDKDIGYEMFYLFEDDKLTVTACANGDATFHLPLICLTSEQVKQSENEITVAKQNGTIRICYENNELTLPQGTQYRDFSLIGGFITLPIEAHLQKDKKVTFSILV